MTQVLRLADEPSISGGEGIETRTIVGENAMLNVTRLDPGAEIKPHSHPHEQVGTVLEGTVTLTINGAEHSLGPGHAYQIVGSSEHSLRAGHEGARLVDTFHPVREEYRRLARCNPIAKTSRQDVR